MTMRHTSPAQRNPQRNTPQPSGHDVTLVPLALSLAAFAMSCAVLFMLAIAEPGRLWHVAVAIVAVVAWIAASWRLHRLHRREPRHGGVCPSTLPRSNAPPATVLQFSELRTTACRHEPLEGRAFAVRCFHMDCSSPPGCIKEATVPPAAPEA